MRDTLKPLAPFFTPETLGLSKAQAPAPTGNAQPIVQRDAEQPVALTPILAIPFIKMLRDQRDECADALRILFEAVGMDNHNRALSQGKKGKAWDGNFVRDQMRKGMDAADAALDKVPTYQYRLQNIIDELNQVCPAEYNGDAYIADMWRPRCGQIRMTATDTPAELFA